MANQTIKLENLSNEQLQLLAAFAAQNGLQIGQPKQQKVKEIDHLNYKDEARTMAICLAHSEHEFAINEITDEELKTRCKKAGLCPTCLAILDEAEVIKKKIARTRQFVDNQPSADKPGFKIRELVKNNAAKLAKDKKTMKILMDAEACKAKFKLQYALLIDITGKDDAKIAISRKDSKGYVRYSPQKYMIGKRVYLMTNDLYAKNLQPIQDFFNDTFIQDEKLEDSYYDEMRDALNDY